MLNFQEMLEYERLKRGLSLDSFAELVGVSRRSLVYHIEGRNPSASTIKLYSDSLGIDFAQIIVRQRRNNL